ncbi:MAG: S-formylglutathione hydrolase FrmB [Planctomycetota bacterium]|jgi:S-formylglutathione hydrolase FrmB
MKFTRLVLGLPLSLLLFASISQAQEAAKVGAFEITFDAEIFGAQTASAFQGEVFIAFSEDKEPRHAVHAWFNAPPVMRFDMSEVEPGSVVTVSTGDAIAMHPLDLAGAEPQIFKVQAIARLSRTGRQAGLSSGDVYSKVQEISFVPSSQGVVSLVLNQVAEERAFEETERIRVFEFVSPALSEFHGFEYTMKAGVLLPNNYDESMTYPVLYSVTGFGGDHRSIGRWQRGLEGSPLDQCIIVVPDANNRYGHSVFCDSDSIGPWGQALVHEMIPALEEEFHGAGAEQRYVTGISSGGWSSLWLQVAYPDQFSGCWSHVPDPIDFHDFQQINLYEPLADGSPRNMFVDESGEKRPLARRDGKVMLHYVDFVERENVLNPGGQIRSFEGTFSPLLPDGTPRRVFDVESGEIDHEAAKAWKKYDISNTLLTGWDELRPNLKGKIHVYAGEIDTFYLEGAVERFQKLAGEAGMLDDMVIEVIPDMTHSQHRPGFQDMVDTIGERATSGTGE